MKQVLFSMLLISAASSISLAQVTLNAANSNPVQGDIYYMHTWDTSGIRVGAAGANVTWDFTGATDGGLVDSSKFYNCSSTLCDSFPGSNLFSVSGYGDTTFYTTNSTKFSLNGYQTMFGGVYYSNPQDVLRYPFTYNSVFVDTSRATMPSFMVRHWQADSMICDGWGTLRLPGRTETGVLRVRNISHTRDTATEATQARSESYIWLKPGYHMPILSVSYDTAGGSRYISDVSYFTGTFRPTSVGTVAYESGNFAIFPNPATDNITIALTSAYGAPESISIFDMTGRQVLAEQLTNLQAGENKVTIITEQLTAGNYIVKKKSSVGTVTATLIIRK